MTEKILEILLFMPGFLFSLSFHEASHGFMANLKGDPTAKNAGRITLNPIPHTDLLGTIILPIAGLLFGGFLFGWGVPVPVNYRNLKNFKRDAFWIALAGPLSNMFLAFAFAAVIFAFKLTVPFLLTITSEFVISMIFQALQNIVFLNLALCFFNLIPVEPLDGGKILFGILPNHIGIQVEKFTSRFGYMILMVLLFSGILHKILLPPIEFFGRILLSV